MNINFKTGIVEIGDVAHGHHEDQNANNDENGIEEVDNVNGEI